MSCKFLYQIALADQGGERPKFKKDTFYDYDVNEAYSMDGQVKETDLSEV